MRKEIELFDELDYIRRNPHSRWSCQFWLAKTWISGRVQDDGGYEVSQLSLCRDRTVLTYPWSYSPTLETCISIWLSGDVLFCRQTLEIFTPKSITQTSKDVFMDNVCVSDANNLRFRICIVGNSGIVGHLSFEGTKTRMSEYFLWKSFEEDVKSFCSSSLHFRVNDKPFVPGPLGETEHGTAPNQVLHYNFLYIQKKLKSSNHPFQWVVVLKDGF